MCFPQRLALSLALSRKRERGLVQLPLPKGIGGLSFQSILNVTPLILYTRTGCSLCQAMEAQLAQLGPEGLFTLTTIDLEDHPELESRYGEWVPVLMAGETELCHYHLDETVLRDWLVGQLPT